MKNKTLLKECKCIHCQQKLEQINNSRLYWDKLISNKSLIKKAINKIITPWYSIPLIDRWLLGQMVPPMVFAISAFTVISLSVGVMFDLIRKIVEYGLPLFLALKVLFFSLPSFLVLSFPMAVLLSTLLAYGKLSSNSELLALKSLGIKTSRIIAPAIALSIFFENLLLKNLVL